MGQNADADSCAGESLSADIAAIPDPRRDRSERRPLALQWDGVGAPTAARRSEFKRRRRLMTNTTRSVSLSTERSQFDDFLFAPIGPEPNGMLLSVLSALARLDIDPWGEAASLAQMSTEAATERMRSLIASLPEETASHANASAIAARLIALLPPRQPTARPMSTKTTPGAPALAINHRVVVFLFVMALMLSLQFLMRSARPPAQADGDHSSAPSIMSSSNSPR